MKTKNTKNFFTAFLLCLFLGNLGAHRFYVGKVKTGIFMIMTAGGLGLWWLLDIARLILFKFEDEKGRILRPIYSIKEKA